MVSILPENDAYFIMLYVKINNAVCTQGTDFMTPVVFFL